MDPHVLIDVQPAEATPETLEPHPHPTIDERSKAVKIIARAWRSYNLWKNNKQLSNPPMLEENAMVSRPGDLELVKIKIGQENHADMDTSEAGPSFGGEWSSQKLKENAEIGPAPEPMDPSEAEPSRSEPCSRSKLKEPEEIGSTSRDLCKPVSSDTDNFSERFQPETRKIELNRLIASGDMESFNRLNRPIMIPQLSPQDNSILHVAAQYKQGSPKLNEIEEIGSAPEPMDPSEAEPSRSEPRSRSKLKEPVQIGSTSGDFNEPVSSDTDNFSEGFQPEKWKIDLYRWIALGNMESFNRLERPITIPQLTPQNNSALHVAAQYKQADMAAAIIERVPELVNFRNTNGDLPLHIAARVGCKDTSDVLIKQKVLNENIKNKQGDTPLHDAVRGAHLKVVKSLVEKYPSWTRTVNGVGESPLFLAVDKWHFDIANVIFPVKDCSIRGRDSMNVLHAAIIRLGPGHQFSRFRSFRIIKAILYAVLIDPNLSSVQLPLVPPIPYTPKSTTDSKESKHDAYDIAECVKFVKKVSSKRQDAVSEADEFGLTPFHYAAHYGCLAIFKPLLEAGDSIAYKRDKLGMSAVHIAARNGCVPIIKMLIEKFPDAWELLNDKGMTALHVAVESGKQDVVDYLLEAPGFEGFINKKDKYGNTPLHLASIQGNHGILVKLAGDIRVDGSAINNKGSTAVDIVQSSIKFTHSEKAYISFRLNNRFGLLTLKEEVRQTTESEDRPVEEIDTAPREEADSQSNGNGMYKDDMLVVVATLIASVTFGAALQIPGGYKSDDPGKGSATMIKHLMFNIFVLADCFSFALSSGSIFVHFWASIEKSSAVAKKFRRDARILTNLSIGGMVVAFTAGIHVALGPSPTLWAASSGLCIFFLWGPMLIFNRTATMIYEKAKHKWYLARENYLPKKKKKARERYLEAQSVSAP